MFVLKKASKGSAAAWKQVRDRASALCARVSDGDRARLSSHSAALSSRVQTRKQAMTMGAYCVAVRFAYLVCNWGR